MRYTAHMPELSEDHAVFGMNGFGHFAPSGDLLCGMNAWSPGVTLTARLDLRAFSDQQASTDALLVILGHQFVGDVARLCAALAGQRRQDDAVLQGVGTQFGWGEESAVFHRCTLFGLIRPVD